MDIIILKNLRCWEVSAFYFGYVKLVDHNSIFKFNLLLKRRENTLLGTRLHILSLWLVQIGIVWGLRRYHLANLFSDEARFALWWALLVDLTVHLCNIVSGKLGGYFLVCLCVLFCQLSVILTPSLKYVQDLTYLHSQLLSSSPIVPLLDLL